MNAHDIIAGVSTLATLATAYFGLLIKLEISKLREFIAEARRIDKEALQEWAEKHFARRDGAG
jgi:hypothetical protein